MDRSTASPEMEPHVPCLATAGGVGEGWRVDAAFAGKDGETGYTNKMANFRGTGHKIGNKAKQRTKQAKAAALQAPKTSSRSHLLTNAEREVSV